MRQRTICGFRSRNSKRLPKEQAVLIELAEIVKQRSGKAEALIECLVEKRKIAQRDQAANRPHAIHAMAPARISRATAPAHNSDRLSCLARPSRSWRNRCRTFWNACEK